MLFNVWTFNSRRLRNFNILPEASRAFLVCVHFRFVGNSVVFYTSECGPEKSLQALPVKNFQNDVATHTATCIVHLFILCSTASWGLFYKHRVPSLQVSNYRSSRAWCDQSNKIDRVRGAKRNWKSPRSILKFQSYNSLVRFAKPLSEGRSEVKLLAYNLKGAALRERRVQILKWLESRMWKD